MSDKEWEWPSMSDRERQARRPDLEEPKGEQLEASAPATETGPRCWECARCGWQLLDTQLDFASAVCLCGAGAGRWGVSAARPTRLPGDLGPVLDSARRYLVENRDATQGPVLLVKDLYDIAANAAGQFTVPAGAAPWLPLDDDRARDSAFRKAVPLLIEDSLEPFWDGELDHWRAAFAAGWAARPRALVYGIDGSLDRTKLALAVAVAQEVAMLLDAVDRAGGLTTVDLSEWSRLRAVTEMWWIESGLTAAHLDGWLRCVAENAEQQWALLAPAFPAEPAKGPTDWARRRLVRVVSGKPAEVVAEFQRLAEEGGGKPERPPLGAEATLKVVGAALRHLVAVHVDGEDPEFLRPAGYLADALALLDEADPRAESAVQAEVVRSYLVLRCNKEAAQRFIARDFREALAAELVEPTGDAPPGDPPAASATPESEQGSPALLGNGDPDYGTACTSCGATPTLHPTGPCATGDASTAGGNW